MEPLLSGSCSRAAGVSPSAVSASLPWTVAHQAPLSMGFPRQEYWSGFSGDIPDPGIEHGCPALQADSLLSEPPGKQVEAP